MKYWIAEMFKKQQAAYDAIFQSQSASIKALENQIGNWPMLRVTDHQEIFPATQNQIRGTEEMSNVKPSL